MRRIDMKPMNIKEIVLRKLKMRMRHPFTTSFGTQQDRYFYLIEAIDEQDRSGWVNLLQAIIRGIVRRQSKRHAICLKMY